MDFGQVHVSMLGEGETKKGCITETREQMNEWDEKPESEQMVSGERSLSACTERRFVIGANEKNWKLKFILPNRPTFYSVNNSKSLSSLGVMIKSWF